MAIYEHTPELLGKSNFFVNLAAVGLNMVLLYLKTLEEKV
jgi:hypothetical protein